jgi:hypothetical protein
MYTNVSDAPCIVTGRVILHASPTCERDPYTRPAAREVSDTRQGR